MTDSFDTLPEMLRPPKVNDFKNGNAHGIVDQDDSVTVTWWRAQDIGRALGLPDRDTRRICTDLFEADCGMVRKTYRAWWLNELAIVPFALMARSLKHNVNSKRRIWA